MNTKSAPQSGAFLQSDGWEKFQQSVGRSTMRIAGVLVIEMSLPLGLKYWYVPRCELDKKMLEKIVEESKKQAVVFVRYEPVEVEEVANTKTARVGDMQPAATRIVDLTQTEENLLSQMKSKTRYNIRLAKKKEVVVQEARGDEGLLKFLKLIKKTADRHGFSAHDEHYYKKMVKVLGGDARVLVARYSQKVRAAGLFVSHGKTLTYLHGASSEKNKEVMAPYLMHWSAMLRAKKEGFKYYDFWGVAPKDKKYHSLSGVTRFKEGFGGEYLEYPGTFEIILKSFWYRLIKIYRKLRA